MMLSLGERIRARFQEPRSAVQRLGISKGQTVADIGAGTGYFTVPAALEVGAGGLVYSVEPDISRCEKVRRRASTERLENVRVINSKAEQMGEIPSVSVDLAFSAFSFHHFDDRRGGVTEIRRTLKTGGVFYIWDRRPGVIVSHGTRPEELGSLSDGFAKFELLEAGRTVRGRFTK